jgi:uncharacterized protein
MARVPSLDYGFSARSSPEEAHMTREHESPGTAGARVEEDPGNGLRVLDDDECIELLTRHRLGRLAFIVEEQAVIFPVNYVYDGTSVVIRTAPGFKLEEAPFRAAAFEIDDANPEGNWGWSVMVQGPCFDVTDAIDERSERLKALPVQPWAPGAREHWLSVLARHISGRAFGKVPPERPT